MTWRTVYLCSQAHLSFKDNYLAVRGEDAQYVHLSEIHTIIIDSNLITCSVYLLNEIAKRKIKLIICDSRHNPSMEMMPYYGSFDTARMVEKEISWKKETCDHIYFMSTIWKYLVLIQS